MNLSQKEEDALTEVVNIGVGKAAKHLSILLNDKIKMTIPQLIYGAQEDLPKMLGMDRNEILVGIQQQLDHIFLKNKKISRPLTWRRFQGRQGSDHYPIYVSIDL